MKPLLKHAAQALVDTACTCEERDCETLAEATLGYLRRFGCSHNELRAFVRAVKAELRRSNITTTIHMTTPTGKSPDHAGKVAQAFEKTFGRKVELEEHADPYLIGGVTVAYGDERFDASLRGALERLQSQLAAA